MVIQLSTTVGILQETWELAHPVSMSFVDLEPADVVFLRVQNPAGNTGNQYGYMGSVGPVTLKI